MATKNFNDISSDIIDSILIVNPDTDVKIGSVIRDVFIDPQALQIENLYVIADTTAQAQSILTARRQQLDRLAYNFGLLRNQPVPATANVTIVIQNGVAAPTLLNIGDQFYTNPDQNNIVQTFINTQTTMLTTGQTQATIPVINIVAGSAGNVAANTIINSSYDFASSVYNSAAAEGGVDLESDASFSTRIPFAVTGKYINVYNGILNLVQGVNNVVGTPYIITPDNVASRGIYTTDVYLRENAGYYGNVVQETAPANTNDYIFQQQPLFLDNPINSVLLVNPNNTAINTAVPSTAYEVLADGSDAQGFYIGSVKARQRLHWLTSPPAVPYIISYNVDQPVIDAQNQFDQYNEITNDLLFKSAPNYPLFVSANLTVLTGTDYATTYQNALNNLINLLNNLDISKIISKKDFEYAILQDSNVIDVNLTNLDTTYEISFTLDSTGTVIGINPLLSAIPQSLITPFAYYAQSDTSTSGDNNPLTIYGIVSSLWIGSPQYINKTFYSSNSNISSLGVQDSQTIQNINTSWTVPPINFYDSSNDVYIVNLTSLPSSATGYGTVNFNVVQPTINTSGTLNYLTLAPSLVSPIKTYSGTNRANQQYATYLPNGLLLNAASVYKNGIPLIPSAISTIGDFTYLNPDGTISNSGPVINPSTNLINLTFTTAPASTDILQFGLLNPNISVSYGNR